MCRLRTSLLWILMAVVSSVCVVQLASTDAMAAPVVPGFVVQEYASVPFPTQIAVDPEGVLYVGQNPFTGHEPNPTTHVFRVPVGGGVGVPYGDLLPHIANAVAFDASGAIAAQPGSVIAAGFNTKFSAIFPDETTVPLFSSGPVSPAKMTFDKTGRLLNTDVFVVGEIWGTDGSTAPTILFTGPPGVSSQGIAINGSNRIFSGWSDGVVRVTAPDGTLLDPSFASGFGIPTGLAFGPFDSVWGGDLFLVEALGSTVFRLDSDGNVSTFGTGFSDLADVTFGPDGSMFLSSRFTNTVYRVFVPEPSALCLGALGTIAFGAVALRRRRARFR